MRVFYFLFLLLLAPFAYGQWFSNLSTFTTQNGLSNNTVTGLQKDSAGFLWVGTHEGLNRYDGTAFLNVLSNSKNNLPSNSITKFCFINRTFAAVGTESGLCLLNTKTLTGRRIELPLYPKFSATGYFIEDVLYKKETKEIWVCTWHGVFVLAEDGTLKRKLMAPLQDMSKGGFSQRLLTDKNGLVYFYSKQQNGFYYPDFTKGRLIALEQKLNDFDLNLFAKNNYVLRSAQMLDGEVVCIFSKAGDTGSEDYMAYYNNKTGRHFIDRLVVDFNYEKRFSNAYPLNDSLFLVNSYFGEPLLYNTVSHQLTKAAATPLWFTSWPDGIGTFLLKDQKNIWVGTAKGLVQSSLTGNYFKTNAGLNNLIQGYSSLVSYNYGIYHNHKLWLACMGAGLFDLDTTTNAIRAVFDKAPHPQYNKKRVATTLMEAGGSLWLFSVYGPIQVAPQTKTLSAIEGKNKDAAFDDWARLPFKDHNGNIWASLPNGVAKYNTASRTFVNYKTKYEGGSFPLLRPGVKTEDGSGNIWMARQDTLVKYDPVRETFSVVLVTKDGKPLRGINGLASDGDDVLYLSAGGAFGLFHIRSGSVDVFTKQTGIISTAINEVISDKDGNAWLATEGGLVFYNKKKMKFSSYTKADGLPDDAVVGVNFADEKKNVLFLGFAKTYCLLTPDDFLLQKSVPNNVITGVEVNEEAWPPEGNPTLSYQQNSIAFTYTGIDYNQGQQNNYACMLEGFDKDWKYTGTERKINYINLPAATYTFKMKSANHQGEWNDEAALFSFTIAPPFWQRWWFRTLLIGGIIFSVYYFIKRREVALQKETNLKLQMSELRMQALRAQMNPHFIFNSLNSIQNYILSNNTMDAAGYLSKFAKLMRRILDQSKHNFLPLGEVMETLKMYVQIEAFRFNNEFSYSFTVAEDDDLLEVRVPPMLFQPFVENAILHGLMPKAGEKKLLIDCRLVAETVQITIDDNGIGRTQQQPKAGHQSQGEKLTTGMLESLQQLQNSKATIEVTDKKEGDAAAGTTVTFIIPLK